MQAPVTAPVAWREVDALAEFHRVRPLLAKRISRLDLAPPDVAAEMTSRFRQNAIANLLLTQMLAGLVAAFKAERIPVLPHKGPVLAALAYCDPALRKSGDLDLLVHRADLARAMELLERLGYARPSRLAWPPAEALCQYGSEVIFMSARGIAADLHWRLAPPHYPLQLKSSIVWREQSVIRLASTDIPVPAPEPNLLLLALHGARHAWERLGCLADLAWLTRSANAPDWRNASGSGTTNGIIFGGKLSYSPTPTWILGLTVDETQNISHVAASSCSLALSSSTTSTTPLPVSSCASVWLSAIALSTDWKITRLWSAYARFDYEHTKFLETPEVDIAWLASAGMRYEVARNTFLTADYQHSRAISAGPLGSWKRDYVLIGATHHFWYLRDLTRTMGDT